MPDLYSRLFGQCRYKNQTHYLAFPDQIIFLMASNLFQLLQWAKENGEVKILHRIRLKAMLITLEEGINLSEIEPDTTCSKDCLFAINNIITELVGKPYPHLLTEKDYAPESI